MSGASRILVGADGIDRVSLALERSGVVATGLPGVLRTVTGESGSSKGEKFKTRDPIRPVGDPGSIDDLLLGLPKFSLWDDSAAGLGDDGDERSAALRAASKSAPELLAMGPAVASTFSELLSERKKA
jgi:hypothetical protein